MDSSPRKRGRPKLCVTKEVLEERRAQKRLQNAARRGQGSATRTSQAAIPQGSLTGASQAAIPEGSGTGTAQAAILRGSGTGTSHAAILQAAQRICQKSNSKKSAFYSSNSILDIGKQDHSCDIPP
ncbi:hypothetical protein ACET3Z_004934 [Daucus carota]